MNLSRILGGFFLPHRDRREKKVCGLSPDWPASNSYHASGAGGWSGPIRPNRGGLGLDWDRLMYRLP
jgi:hypothetical protein